MLVESPNAEISADAAAALRAYVAGVDAILPEAQARRCAAYVQADHDFFLGGTNPPEELIDKRAGFARKHYAAEEAFGHLFDLDRVVSQLVPHTSEGEPKPDRSASATVLGKLIGSTTSEPIKDTLVAIGIAILDKSVVNDTARPALVSTIANVVGSDELRLGARLALAGIGEASGQASIAEALMLESARARALDTCAKLAERRDGTSLIASAEAALRDVMKSGNPQQREHAASLLAHVKPDDAEAFAFFITAARSLPVSHRVLASLGHLAATHPEARAALEGLVTLGEDADAIYERIRGQGVKEKARDVAPFLDSISDRCAMAADLAAWCKNGGDPPASIQGRNRRAPIATFLATLAGTGRQAQEQLRGPSALGAKSA
jgi:hypothetical protein